MTLAVCCILSIINSIALRSHIPRTMPSVCREVIQSTVLLCQHSSLCLFAWLRLHSRDGVFSLVTHVLTSHVSMSSAIFSPSQLFFLRSANICYSKRWWHIRIAWPLCCCLLLGILLQWECDRCGRNEFLHSRRLYNRLNIRCLATLQGHLTKAYVRIIN